MTQTVVTEGRDKGCGLRTLKMPLYCRNDSFGPSGLWIVLHYDTGNTWLNPCLVSRMRRESHFSRSGLWCTKRANVLGWSTVTCRGLVNLSIIGSANLSLVRVGISVSVNGSSQLGHTVGDNAVSMNETIQSSHVRLQPELTTPSSNGIFEHRHLNRPDQVVYSI